MPQVVWIVLLLSVGCGPQTDLGKAPGIIDSSSTEPSTTAESRPPDDDSPSDSDSPPESEPSPPPPPAVVLFVGDGMGLRHIAGGGLYAYGAEGSLILESLPYVGRLRTASYSGVTDSAASATAMASGVKTFNGRLGLDRYGFSVESVRELAAGRGLATGVVTTDKLYGATPSAFTVHNEDRGDDALIAADLVAAGLEISLGGGATALTSLVEGDTFQVVTTAGGLAALVTDDRPIFGLFADGELPYVADGYGEAPSLAEMALAAVTRLEQDPDGFFLMVEGARIDHASHSRRSDAVHLETAALDEAVGAVLAHLEGHENLTVLVTADHECGGIMVEDGTSAGTIPTTDWRWNQHTNLDVGVFGLGEAAAVLDGQRLDNAWVHSVLRSAVTGDPVIEPEEVWLPDGYTEDLGPPASSQLWATSFGERFNQLDALRVTADTYGLWIGVDGVFERDQNAVLVFLDVDHGVGAPPTTLLDEDGGLDTLITRLVPNLQVPGFGIDFVVGSLGAYECAEDDAPYSDGCLRGVHAPLGVEDDFAWFGLALNFDDGNIAENLWGVNQPATDAGAVGATIGGMEFVIPWTRIFPDGIPADTRIGAFALLSNEDGDHLSNQLLPPAETSADVGAGIASVNNVVLLDLNADGTPALPAYLSP